MALRPNKTDANDAEGLAQLLRTGFYREVRAKSWDSMLLGKLVTARCQLVCSEVDLATQLRAILRTFGLVLPPGGCGGRDFEAAVREPASMRPGVEPDCAASAGGVASGARPSGSGQQGGRCRCPT
ncbi:IS110 family transposase [Roseomonas chloroacetimidivorans]|uniref:IS110 family transposase n=1 Tax=Roseomonas chloroacetimidivorans TaxID=1766656 RepID=UPI003C74F2B0